MGEMRDKSYSTGDLMKKFDVGRNTLRLYEDMGLLSDLKRTDAGYRKYSASHAEDLAFVLEAKKTGFTLAEIKDLLDIMRNQKRLTCGQSSSVIANKVTDIDSELQLLQAKKAFLSSFLTTCQAKEPSSVCDVKQAGFQSSACCN